MTLATGTVVAALVEVVTAPLVVTVSVTGADTMVSVVPDGMVSAVAVALRETELMAVPLVMAAAIAPTGGTTVQLLPLLTAVT